MYIKAECHSDDHASEVTFDAVDWFSEAEDSQLIELAQCGWGGDYVADAIAEWMTDRNDEIGGMFEYIRVRNKVGSGDHIGFECHIEDMTIALDWIAEYRNEVYEKLQEMDLTFE